MANTKDMNRITANRTAEHAGHIYLDLADEHWRAVDIGPDGWAASAAEIRSARSFCSRRGLNSTAPSAPSTSHRSCRVIGNIAPDGDGTRSEIAR
jgi:hypothetical protein